MLAVTNLSSCVSRIAWSFSCLSPVYAYSYDEYQAFCWSYVL